MQNKYLHFTFLAVMVLLLSYCSPAQKENNTQAVAPVENKPLFTAAIGVQAYSFRNSFPHGVAETLDTIQSMGITEIEGRQTDIDPREYKKLCEERGISIPAIGASYEKLVNSTQEIIDEANIYGAKYVMVAWIPHDTDVFTPDDANQAIKDFNEAGKVLSENGLTLCYHAHGYEFQPYGEATLMEHLIEKTDAQYVSFEMDIFWIHFGGGDPVALMNKYPDRWKLMHLKDMKKGIPKDLTGHTNVEHNVTLGTGEVDVEGVMRAAKKAGVNHYFIEDESSRIITQIPASIDYLRSLKE